MKPWSSHDGHRDYEGMKARFLLDVGLGLLYGASLARGVAKRNKKDAFMGGTTEIEGRLERSATVHGVGFFRGMEACAGVLVNLNGNRWL